MTPTLTEATPVVDAPTVDPAVDYLEREFPGWSVSTDATAGWNGTSRTLWIARRDGHHPQAELSPGRLHTRLEEYLARIAHRGHEDGRHRQ